MKLEHSFKVPAPPEAVWSALIDVQRVAPCLPGAQITEAANDGTYHGTFTVKLGPTTAEYRGTLKMATVDEGARTARMSARGTDKRGQGGASAEIVSTVTRDGDAARVELVTDMHITGRLARFGRSGMIEDISNRLLREFSACLQERLASEPRSFGPARVEPSDPARPIRGLSLFLSVLRDRLRQLFRRGEA